MKVTIGVPRRTYYITYYGVVIHVENEMTAALDRLPRSTRGWTIWYALENDPEGTPYRVAWQGES